MEWWKALVLGIIQGLTEFLPVSSSGHLVIGQKLLGFEHHSLAFDVVAHLGTLLAVLTVYRALLFRMTTDTLKTFTTRQATPGFWLVVFVVIATIPTAIIGLTFKDVFESLFDSLLAVGIFLIVTAGILWLTRGRGGELKNPNELIGAASELTPKRAFLIGLIQAAAIAPGISRSGSTIAAGILQGLSRSTAAFFSFLLAIPAMVGAAILELSDVNWANQDVIFLGIGFVSAYVSGLCGLILILKAVRSGKLEVFSPYLLVLGSVAIVYSLYSH